MHVLHINCNYIGTTLHQLMVENLDKLGYQNSVFVPVYSKEPSAIQPNDNVLVSECFNKWDRALFDYKQRKILKALKKHYQVQNYDLIHAYTLFTDGNCARKLSKEYGVPYVVAVRNTDVNTFFRLMPYLRNRGIKIMLDASAVFFLSEAYKRQVFEKYVPAKYREEIEKKTYIVPNGIDEFWFENTPLQDNQLGAPIKLIYAGRIDSNKNIATTQKAMELLREKGHQISLTVVGNVADEKVYAAIKNDPYTQCIPAQPKQNLLELYRQHNIFVMPSFTESFGLVYAEAMSQGLPVIYSQGQGFDNHFPEGTVGYRVDAYDAQSVADGIEKVIDHFEEIVQNVVSSAKVFNWKDLAARYDSVYRMMKREG